MNIEAAREELKSLTPMLDACIARVSLGDNITDEERAALNRYHDLVVKVAEAEGKRR